jgi:hypothetical protein
MEAWHVARTMRVLELLACNSLSAPQLAEALGAHPRTVRRVVASNSTVVRRALTDPGRETGRRDTRPADDEIERLAQEAERGYSIEEVVARRGERDQPTSGTGPVSVESVRLDPDRRAGLAERARVGGTTTSEVICEALGRYLDTS